MCQQTEQRDAIAGRAHTHSVARTHTPHTRLRTRTVAPPPRAIEPRPNFCTYMLFVLSMLTSQYSLLDFVHIPT